MLIPLGYSQVAGLSVAKGLADGTLGIPTNGRGDKKASRAVISTEGQNVRWRDDGVNPTAASGMLLTTSTPLVYDGDLNAIKFIEVAAGAKLHIAFYR